MKKNNEILIHNSSINELLHYDLINLNGIKVQSGKISNSSITLNENISTGIYFLRLINNNSHVISQTKLFYNN
ncbi:MAG: T9SS type A sorting domain-containing protein [Saprospiraceae bacterium]|nr:T9SS type A sorting domain-containing protein [Saprospiraceae bacterium]